MLIECEFGRIQVFGGLLIADYGGDVIELLQRPSWLEVLFGLGQGFQFVIGGHHGLIGVPLPRFPLGVDHHHREKAGPVKVDVRIEVVAREDVELWCPLLGDVDIAQLLPNDRPIFAFHSGIVVAMAGAGLGQFDQQLVEQSDHVLIDVLGAVVGMERQNDKGKLLEEVFQHRNQVPFAAFLHRTDDFELGHLIDRIDMGDTLHPIQIALVDRIDAQIPRLAIGLGLPAFAEAGDRETGLVNVLANMSVTGAMPEDIQITHGDASQPMGLGLPETHPGTFT